MTHIASSETPPLYSIRPAKVDEVALLTEIALRSKAYWGYGAEFMAAARGEMTVTVAQLAAHTTYVLEVEGEVVGFYKLCALIPGQVELTDLFLDPPAIGHGRGRILWQHAVATARALGYAEMTWQSDPNAEGFYLRMGAVRTGEVESTVKPGRLLPTMSYRL